MNPNTYQNQRLRGLKRKIEAINSLGGKCSICGYNKNIASLEFHHLDPSKKDFQLDARKFANSSPQIIKDELAKCILVCSNCHQEIHNPDLTFELIEKMQEVKTKKGLHDGVGQFCPICNKHFPKNGRTYCSKECNGKAKQDKRNTFPSLEELEKQYTISKSWEKVAKHFNLTRRIVQRLRN